jgi:hypothetical protein
MTTVRVIFGLSTPQLVLLSERRLLLHGATRSLI